MSNKHQPLTEEELQALEKGQIHEHLDCSPCPRYLLRRWFKLGFDKVNPRLPQQIELDWRAAQAVRASKQPDANDLADSLERRAAHSYQLWLARFASESLANYVQAIRDHILPVMQTSIDLYEITRERIQQAVADGHIFLELRFAPQLHTAGGLTLEGVMSAVISAVNQSPIPVKLVVCALRHENDKRYVEHNPVELLAELAIAYPQVGVFDLAADEAAYPGVLDWYVEPAKRVLESGKILDIHLGETNALTRSYTAGLKQLYPSLSPADRGKLARVMKHVQTLCQKFSVSKTASAGEKLFDQVRESLDSVEDLIFRSGRLGHGIRGDKQGTYVLGVCPTSNVVTGQVEAFEAHPVSRLLRAGKLVTVNTDGTLFTLVDLSKEYGKLQKAPHNFRLIDFYVVNRVALAASSFSLEQKQVLKAKLDAGYRGRLG